MSEKFKPSDFIMVEVSTPLGDPTLISQTAFLAESDETERLNFWSPNPNIPKQPPTIEVKTKMKRPISEHILAILEKCTKPQTFAEIKQLLINAGFKHTSGMINDNLKLLVAAGKLVVDKECFGVPQGVA